MNLVRLFDDLVNKFDYKFAQDGVQLFIADDIQTKLDANPEDNDSRNWSSAEYGQLAPPFPRFFIEASQTDKQYLLPDYDEVTVGLMFDDVSTEFDLPEHPQTDKPKHPANTPDGTYWLLQVTGFRREVIEGKTHYAIPGGATFVHINIQGYIADDTRIGFQYYNMPNAPHIVSKSPSVTALDTVNTVKALPFALFTLHHLFNRGVNVMSVEPMADIPRNRRRRMERNGEVLHSYHVLDLHPERKRYETSGNKTGGKKRQHFRRGHFKFYSPAKPHVSGLIGAMYVSASTPGSDDKGTVEKLYNIKG